MEWVKGRAGQPGHGSSRVYHRRRPRNSVGTQASGGEKEEFPCQHGFRGDAGQENPLRPVHCGLALLGSTTPEECLAVSTAWANFACAALRILDIAL